MKKWTIFLFLAANISLNAQQTANISVGASYANDVYFSFDNGVVGTVARDNWHIAFTTKIVDASILINDGMGVELYIASNDVADFNTLDTTGMSWTPLHNSPKTWAEGAFNDQNSGHPDYGWGTYNNITHNVSGKRVFVMKLPDGSFKKMVIDEMLTTGDFSLRMADLDGNNLITKTLNKNAYVAKNFIYWDVVNDSIIDREPAKTDWDLLFTRYQEEILPGTYYPVSGAKLNINVFASKAANVDTNTVDWRNYYPLADSVLAVGSNWKSFNNTTFMWSIADSLAYFVQSLDGNLYQLVFKDFGGSSTGNITFTYRMVSAMSVAEYHDLAIEIFPQPASDILNVSLAKPAKANLYAITGALVWQGDFQKGVNQLSISHLPKGVYVLYLNSKGVNCSQKIVIQ